jgi:hypothetical protein
VQIKLRDNPTYIFDDDRVEIKVLVDDNEQRIVMSLGEYMEFVADQVNALTNKLTGHNNPRINTSTDQ